jgi:hypothetical protein
VWERQEWARWIHDQHVGAHLVVGPHVDFKRNVQRGVNDRAARVNDHFDRADIANDHFDDRGADLIERIVDLSPSERDS